MSGLLGSDLSSFRPDDEGPTPSIPRRVLRHLVTNHSLGIGSRILIGGDESEELTCFFNRLGIEATSLDPVARRQEQFDAAVWIDLSQSGRQSLCSLGALERSNSYLQSVRPRGTFFYVMRTAAYGAGHETKCLETHFEQLTDHAQLTVFPDRSLVGFFGGPSRRGFAVGSCHLRSRETETEQFLERRPQTGNRGDIACCVWSDSSTQITRAA